MKVIKQLEWRYAVKKFDESKFLSNEQIDVLRNAFNLTATSYGLQPVKLIILKNKSIQNQLVTHSWNQKQVAQASHVLIFAIPKTYSESEVENYFNLVKKVRNTPDAILNPFKNFLVEDVRLKTQQQLYEWNKNQAYLTMGNLLTVCALEEIDACPMEGFTSEKYDEVLNLADQNLTSVLVLPIGYRAADDYMKDLKKIRRPIDEVVIEIN